MEKNIPKSHDESCISTTGTPTSQHYSDSLDNNLKYINLNFVDNSESSSPAKEAFLEYQKLQNCKSSQEQTRFEKKPLPNKILPTALPLNGLDKNKSEKQIIPLQEKTLLEMGYKANEVEGWENIVQPPKEDLYKLLKNMIEKHIKPSVQIRIGEVTFNCHMMVLQCYSDFFMEWNNEILIQLPEEKITPAAFMMVYDWMLSSQPLVQREGILELFNAANFLRIKELINQCWLCLDDDVRFREDTAFLLYLEARNYGLESLEELMLMRICKFFLTLVASKEFLTLNCKEVVKLLSSNTIGVNSEIEIFMSVVRWLSYNWQEREKYTLELIKCVRFSLIPPWFLVTLNKNTDCLEIDRIIENPEVKEMISDAVTYTTTQFYYGENREEFLHFLERYELTEPMQRQWVFDKECNYHRRLDCPNMEYVTYKSFLEYLEMIRSIGKDYWRSLEMDKGAEKSINWFLRTNCRKTTEPNLATVFTKKSRDQGIQCASSLKYRKSKECNKTNSIHNNVSGKKSVHLTPRGHPRYVPATITTITTSNQTINSINNDTTTEAETTVDFKYPEESDDVEQNFHVNVEKQPETILYDDNNQQQQQQLKTEVNEQQQQQQQYIIDSYPLKHKFSNNIDNDKKIHHQQHQLLSKPYHIIKKQQEKTLLLQHNKTNNTHNNKCCTVIYKRDDDDDNDSLMADVNGDCYTGQQEEHQQQQQQKQCIIGDNHDVENIKHNIIVGGCNVNEDLLDSGEKQTTSTFIDDLTRISNHKILVFGGIDPYCLHCQHVQQHHQKLQQQHHLHQQQSYRLQKQLERLQRKRVLSIDSIIMNTRSHTHYYSSHPSRTHPLQTETQSHTINVVANKNLENFGDHVLFYDIDAMEWRHLSHIPFGSRHHHAVVVCNGLIYVIGGTRTAWGCTKKSVFEKSIWCFNPQTVKWTLETNLPESRRDFAVIAIDNETNTLCIEMLEAHGKGFYVIGGEGVNGNPLSSVWFYNIKRKIWIKKPSLNMGRYGLAAAMVNNEIWVAGGIINDNTVGICGNGSSHRETINATTTTTTAATKTTTHIITDTIEIYNLKCTHGEILANNQTKEFSNCGSSRRCKEEEGGDGESDEDEVEVVIGDSNINCENLKSRPENVAATVNVDCNVGQWIKSKLHLRLPRLFGKFCKMSNGQLYLVGGIGFNDHLNELTSLTDIDVFNEEQHKWEHVGDLNLARHGHDVATLNDHCIVVIGGVSTFEKCTLNKVETFCTKTRKSLKNLPDLPWPVSGCAAVTID
ncbi:uncharacterized protein LOC119613271 isoform X2 [Lucilia sericata]|uniref:uncharacterized protein LOC119613271 isoform X2 n=1 Tax=Lucilia sericata TaxID=13632 RepID=UPI0018A84EF7|nr:uncharacterized protein LOC119613271 isoform X2 [Lucilia sericata]